MKTDSLFANGSSRSPILLKIVSENRSSGKTYFYTIALRTTSFSETPLGLQILQHYRQAALNYRQAVQYKLCSYMDECSARDGEYEDYTTTASSSCLFDDPREEIQ